MRCGGGACEKRGLATAGAWFTGRPMIMINVFVMLVLREMELIRICFLQDYRGGGRFWTD